MDTDNLIPKNLFNQKLLIIMNFSIWDILYVVFDLSLSASIIFPFTKLFIAYRGAIYIVLSAVFLLLLINIPSMELRIYNIIILFFKFLITKKKYRIKTFKNVKQKD